MTKCPAPAGRRLSEIVHVVPKEAPKGTAVTIHTEAKDEDKVIWCNVIHFTLG